MRARVVRSFSFEAAHVLPWHEGQCRNLHGHSYRLEVAVEGPIAENGMVLDFADLKAVVQREVIDHFDHTLLNDLLDNPTAEVIAANAWKRLEAAGLVLAWVRLWETPTSSVEILPS